MTKNKVLWLLAFIVTFNKYFQTSVYAQQKISEPTLESIHVENKLIKLDESNTFTVAVGKAVRIGGTAKPGEKITVFIRDKTYEAVTKNDGSWFVLFSMPNLWNVVEKVEAVAEYGGATSERVLLVNIKSYEPPKNDQQPLLGDDGAKGLEKSTNRVNEKGEITYASYVPIVIIVLFLVIGVVYLIGKKKK